jgi:signal transduction histidine kinase
MAKEEEPPIPGPLASVLYRVAQEALRNAARHAHAKHVEVRLFRENGMATLQVDDNGRGFDVRRAEQRRPGMGLFSMRERVALVNGRLIVTSAPGQGALVVATVPLTNWEQRDDR